MTAGLLQDKVTVVSGVTGGMGRVASRTFCENGAVLIGTDLHEDVGKEWEAELRDAGHDATFVAGDVSRAATAEGIADLVRERHGRLDVLYNNAGIVLGKHVLDITEEEWDRVHDVIAKGTFLMTRSLAPLMGAGGSIVNVASAGGLTGQAGMAAYCAAKAAVVLFTKTCAIDLAPDIRVNAICPGAIDTPMPRQFVATMPDDMAAAVWADLASGHLTGRFGTSEEVVSVGLFLASDQSSFMTGSALLVDGGYTAK